MRKRIRRATAMYIMAETFPISGKYPKFDGKLFNNEAMRRGREMLKDLDWELTNKEGEG